MLAQDGAKVCDVWMQKIRDKYVGETVLTQKHLAALMDALKEYLTEQSLSVVETAVRQLKEELDFDVTAINQLQFAIYLYQVSGFVAVRLPLEWKVMSTAIYVMSLITPTVNVFTFLG